MKMQALIIDDEPLAHRVILEYARDVPFLEITGQCYSATEALSALNTQKPALAFLDIEMPKLKGLELLRTLKDPPIIIITSAYEEYALESYELDVCDYLLKPFRFGRFLKAVNKAFELYQLRHAPPLPSPSSANPEMETPERIFIKSDKRHLQVELADIFYLESYGNYVKVWLEKEYHLTPGTLSSFEAGLPKRHFFRIHKSYIVQKKYIHYLEGNMLYLKNGKKLPIGKSYRQEVKALVG